MLTLSFLRLIFIVVTILITFYDGDDRFLIETDTFKIINLIFFSLSNGYLSTQCCLKAPELVDNSQREKVGLLNGLFMSLGIVLGCGFAIPLGHFLPINWPSAIQN